MKKVIEKFFVGNFDKLPKTLGVAVSGGVDSMALVFSLDEFCRAQGVKLSAITVDHKMRKGSSNEALMLSKILEKHKIAHEILTIESAKLPKSNIEAKLREERYRLLYDYCVKQKIDHLFLAHHQNDLAENFLIRLFRGSQIDGLSKMKEVSQLKKIKLCRPFLSTKKSELQQFLKAKKIAHFEDESNEDEKFLRNKIRKFLASLPESDLIQERIVKFSEILGDKKESEDEILLEKARQILIFQKEGAFLIDAKKYQELSPKIALKILSLVLIEIGGNAYKPRLDGLKNFEKSIFSLKKGEKKNFYGCMAKFLTKNNIAKIETVDEVKKNPQNFLLIYREESAPERPAQKFDEKTQIIDGRFLLKKNGEKIFYFRTLLREIFSK